MEIAVKKKAVLGKTPEILVQKHCKNSIAVRPTICRTSEVLLPKDPLVLGLSVPEQKSLMAKCYLQCHKTRET